MPHPSLISLIDFLSYICCFLGCQKTFLLLFRHFVWISSPFFTPVVDLEHNFPTLLYNKRVFGNLLQLFYFQRKIFLFVFHEVIFINGIPCVGWTVWFPLRFGFCDTVHNPRWTFSLPVITLPSSFL